MGIQKCVTCLCPSYFGVDPMGIFWSMVPEPGSLTRLYSSGPLQYALDIFDMKDIKLFSTTLTRDIYDSTVSREDIRMQGIIGTLFTPSGHGPFPTVVVIDGAARIKEDLAASLAMEGFVVLSLVFFKEEGLPADYSHVKVEYFERAIDLLQGFACVKGGGVGLLGCSKGCDVSLSCASFLPLTKVRAVVTVNGCISSAAGITNYGNNTIQKHGFRKDFSPKPSPVPGSFSFLGIMESLAKLTDDCLIPIEKSEADILMVAGEDDHNFDSVEHAQTAKKICDHYGKTNLTVKTYPGMGHALDAPFSPVATAIPHILAPKGIRVYLGGADKKTASHSQLKGFNDIVNFFQNTLK